MSEQHPRKSSASPAPLFLALLIAVVTLVVLGVVSLLLTGFNARAPAQTGAMARNNESRNNPSLNPASLQDATATDIVESEEELHYELTPSRVLAAPTWPPDRATPEPPPPPTEISYTPGPTAHFDVMAPFEEWTDYVNEGQGFSVKYPPDWYLNPGQMQFFSYDFNNPKLQLNPDLSLDYAKIEILVDDLTGLPPEHQFRENETLREWVYRTGRVGEDDQVLEEEEFLLDGVPALRQFINYDPGLLIETVYLKRPTGLVLITQHYREDFTVPNQIFDLLVSSFRNQQ